jgi:hypothetical protein
MDTKTEYMDKTKESMQERVRHILLEIQLLKLDIDLYIKLGRDETVSYQSYFDKRFPAFKEMGEGINKGIKQLIEMEGK